MIKPLRFLLITVLACHAGLFAISLLLSGQAEHTYPMQGEQIAIEGGLMHVIDTQPAIPAETSLVLVHGASTSGQDFSTNLQPLLSEQYRVMTIDRPGHGYSHRGQRDHPENPQQQALMILDTLEAMQVERVIVIGHSWAGAVVMAALLSDHKTVTVEAGVLIAGATHPWSGGSALPVEVAAHPILGPAFCHTYITPLGHWLMPQFVERAFAPEPVPTAYIENTSLTLSLRPAVYCHNARDRTRLSDTLAQLSTRYATIEQPLLSIAASADTVVPPWNHHERLSGVVPDLQSVMLEGAGHAPHHTRTAEVVATIEAFIERINSTDTDAIAQP